MTVVLLMTDQRGVRSMSTRNVKRKERNRAEDDWAPFALETFQDW